MRAGAPSRQGRAMQPWAGSKQVFAGHTHIAIMWLLLGAQVHAPTKHVPGKADMFAQQSSCSTLPPELRHFASAPLSPPPPALPPPPLPPPPVAGFPATPPEP